MKSFAFGLLHQLVRRLRSPRYPNASDDSAPLFI
ncbi:hypothetical protein HNQ93_003120 [Hymenobacter luteus]|uniref:Uncharacterized protein n=2 Tax=Hymenobacter TaxID=89966 RepID=A0A7W9T3R4_9BACT|nr:hypothetical protein [Hymenobacter latericoloratus]MBB6060254.1 hypothetical protein [Hymenobacter luteus]